MQNKPLKKICFISPRSYPIFNNSVHEIFGGSELRAYLLGTKLAERSEYQVYFVVQNYNNIKREKFDKIAIYAENQCLTLLQRLIIRYLLGFDKKSINDNHKEKVFQEIGADLYISFGVGTHTFQTFSILQKMLAKKCLFLGHDEDVSENYYEGSTFRNRHGYSGHQCWKVIQMADYFVAQSDTQARLLQERFGREAFVLRNPIDLGNKRLPTLAEKDKFILWIGRSNQVKRPELLLELARRAPDLQYVMVMNLRDQAIHDKVYATKPPNVIIHDFVPIDEIEQFFANAKLFVSTSIGEGFPNTFLQAGKYGVPIVSMAIDPDDFISRYQCGIVTGDDMEYLKESISTVLSPASDQYGKYAENILQYVNNHHSLEVINEQLALFLQQI